MAEKVNVFELDINTTALLSKMTETRAAIDKLKAVQKELIDSNQQSSDSFTKNEVEIKKLQTSYNQQSNVVKQLTTSTESFASSTAALNAALAKEVTTIDGAAQNNKQLLTLRNQINASTEEGAAMINSLNAKINQNTAFIKANVSAAEQQKMEIGDYKNQIKEAFNEINVFNGGLSGFVTRSKEAGGVAPLLTSSFAGITTGIGGMIKASLAFIATPLGAAIAAIALVVGAVVGAFKFMTTAMNSTEEGSQKLAKVTATVSGVMRGLFNLVKPLGEFMGKAFIAYFEAAAKAIDATAKGISTALKFLGFKNAAASVDGFTNSIKNGAKAAVDLQRAEAQLQTQQRLSQKIQLDYQKQAEKLRQLRDDESKSIAQRQAANAQLGAVLKQQSAAELSIANQKLKVADLTIKAEGKTTEALNKRAEAQTNISDIQERITGQESEQLQNINSLRKEAADKAKENADKAIAARQAQLDKEIQVNNDELQLLIAKEGFQKKSLADELTFAEQVKNKKLENLKAEFDGGKISKTKYEADKLNITNEYAKKQADVAVQVADAELAAFIRNNQTKIDSNKFFNDTMYQQELDRINRLSEAEAAAQTARYANGLISLEEYNTAIAEIDARYAANKASVDLTKSEADKTKAAADLENKRILEGEAFQYDLQAQQEQENIRYQQELAQAEKTGADITLINAKHAQNQKAIDEAVANNKLSLASSTFGNLATIFGKESAVGKAAAVAQTTIDTYQAATAAYKSMAGIPVVGPALGAVAATAAVVSGIANVKKIVATKPPSFADGGYIPTLSSGYIDNGSNLNVPLSNGDDTLAYVKQGEVILNKEQQARAGGINFFKSIGVPTYANGGYAGISNFKSTSTSLSIDYDKLAASIASANSTLPAPVVSVTDITYQQNRVATIENYANL